MQRWFPKLRLETRMAALDIYLTTGYITRRHRRKSGSYSIVARPIKVSPSIVSSVARSGPHQSTDWGGGGGVKGLCRFRNDPVAFMCDVYSMFHQFKVVEAHRNFLRFLWWEDGDVAKPPKEYRMTVHLFGAGSSPGCANYGLRKIADNHEGNLGSEAANFVRNDFYVDDRLKSVLYSQFSI